MTPNSQTLADLEADRTLAELEADRTLDELEGNPDNLETDVSP